MPDVHSLQHPELTLILENNKEVIYWFVQQLWELGLQTRKPSGATESW